MWRWYCYTDTDTDDTSKLYRPKPIFHACEKLKFELKKNCDLLVTLLERLKYSGCSVFRVSCFIISSGSKVVNGI